MTIAQTSTVSSRASTPARVMRLGAGALGGSLLIGLAAHVAVPFWPVPITLQTLVVLGLAAALGPVAAVAAVLAWIAEGLAGLPVFSRGAGLPALLGPTGGYMIGFVAAAAITGVASWRGWLRAWPGAVAAFLVADAMVFVFGVTRLATLVGWDKAIAGGLTPFLLGEALKIGLLVAATALVTRRA